MAEYIERQKAIDLFYPVDPENDGSDGATLVCQSLNYSSADIESKLSDMPAEDVAPVRNGRWLDVQETDMYVPDLKLTATKTAETCSVCKARIGFIGAKLYLFDSFCPSCGAKMDLEVPENETL